MKKIESTLISKGDIFGDGEEGITEQNSIISDETTWTNLINQIDSVNNISDSFSETDIDFSEYTVIAVFDSIKGNGGFSIELDIIANANNIIVEIINSAPEGNATTVITQPYHIVKIPNSNLPIIFE